MHAGASGGPRWPAAPALSLKQLLMAVGCVRSVLTRGWSAPRLQDAPRLQELRGDPVPSVYAQAAWIHQVVSCRFLLADEELCHDGCGGFRVDVVALAAEDAEPPARQRRRGCPRGVAQERRALLATDNQGRDGDRGEQRGGQGPVTDEWRRR